MPTVLALGTPFESRPFAVKVTTECSKRTRGWAAGRVAELRRRDEDS